MSTNLKLLREAHEITSHIEEEILDQFPSIDKILIHYEPDSKEIQLIAVPLNAGESSSPNENSRLSDHFGEASHFAILRRDSSTKTAFIQDYVRNPYKDLERQRGVKASELLYKYGVDQVRSPVHLAGKGAGYALEAMQIEVVPTASRTLEELIAEINQTKQL